MGIEDKAPNLVMRAMGRLSEAPASPPEPDFTKAEAPLVGDILRPVSVVVSENNSPQEETQGQTIEISPAALASNGIFALSGVSFRAVEEFRAIKHQIRTIPTRRNRRCRD